MENDEYKAMSREEELQQAADEWACLWLNGLKLTKWAYIDDLLPKGGKE